MKTTPEGRAARTKLFLELKEDSPSYTPFELDLLNDFAELEAKNTSARNILSLLLYPGQEVPPELQDLFYEWQSHDEGMGFQHWLARRWLQEHPK